MLERFEHVLLHRAAHSTTLCPGVSRESLGSLASEARVQTDTAHVHTTGRVYGRRCGVGSRELVR